MMVVNSKVAKVSVFLISALLAADQIVFQKIQSLFGDIDIEEERQLEEGKKETTCYRFQIPASEKAKVQEFQEFITTFSESDGTLSIVEDSETFFFTVLTGQLVEEVEPAPATKETKAAGPSFKERMAAKAAASSAAKTETPFWKTTTGKVTKYGGIGLVIAGAAALVWWKFGEEVSGMFGTGDSVVPDTVTN